MKVDAKAKALLDSLALVPGTKYKEITCTPVSFTTREREWVSVDGTTRKGERYVIEFESALGPVSCYIFREDTETLTDAIGRTLAFLGLDTDPQKWGPITKTVTVSRHRFFIIEVPRPAKADAKNDTLAALGL